MTATFTSLEPLVSSQADGMLISLKLACLLQLGSLRIIDRFPKESVVFGSSTSFNGSSSTT